MGGDKSSTTGGTLEQNGPPGVKLKSVKSDLMCGDVHELSILRPTVIIDSHMHIQSGHCVPLQWFQDINCLAQDFSRETLENSAKAGGYLMEFFGTIIPIAWLFHAPFAKSRFRALTEQGAKPTITTADDFMNKRKVVYQEFFQKEDLYSGLSKLVVASIVMTMDMEYAHVDGYYGLKIYNALYESAADIADLKPCAYWCPVHGTWVETIDPSYQNINYDKKITYFDKISVRDWKQYKKTEVEGVPVTPVMIDEYNDKFSKSGVIIGSYFDNKARKTIQVEVNAVPVLTSKDETDTYEQWEKQLQYTELAVLKYPLQLLPMFHYDPRRWQSAGEGNDFPMAQVTGQGLYLGFKMYTAQGYRPLDPRLPIMENFYARCCDGSIPIMNHCTPLGAATYERKEYVNFRHFNDDTAEREFQTGDPEAYFNEHFVSPTAWEKVLKQKVVLNDTGGSKEVYLNELHLCLAHFGGPTDLGKEWSKKIIEMINSGDYPNLYTDISSSFVDRGFREYFKAIITDPKNQRLKDRILFGTDWYMTIYYDNLVNGMDFDAFCTTAKSFLDNLDPGLWPRFVQYNPYRFYRLDQNIGRIAENIIARRKTPEVKRALKMRFEQEDMDTIEKEAAYIKAANRSFLPILEATCIP